MMESAFSLDSYIWGQNREEYLLATSDHFELTVSNFSIVKTTVVLWKQGKQIAVAYRDIERNQIEIDLVVIYNRIFLHLVFLLL